MKPRKIQNNPHANVVDHNGLVGYINLLFKYLEQLVIVNNHYPFLFLNIFILLICVPDDEFSFWHKIFAKNFYKTRLDSIF